MKYRKRRYFTESDKALMWDRWQKGLSGSFNFAGFFLRVHALISGAQ